VLVIIFRILVTILFLVLGAALLILSYQYYKMSQLMRDLPTKKIRSSSMGLSELKGTSEIKNSFLNHPLTGERCIAYRIKIMRKDHKDSWISIKNSKEYVNFMLSGETGDIDIILDKEPIIEFRSSNEDTYLKERLYDISNFDITFLNRILDKLIGIMSKDVYEVSVKAIYPDDPIYIIGDVKRDKDKLYVGEPRDKMPVIISNSGKEGDLRAQLRAKSILFFLGGLICTSLCLFMLFYTLI
jgi:hypothetical protein